MLTLEEFQQYLQTTYNNLTREDIKKLLKDVVSTEDFKQDALILGILDVVLKNRSISFKQWKSLNAYVSKKNQQSYKTF
jgi:hypothetical protein